MKYEIRFTNQFKKDVKLAKKQGKDIEKLFDIVDKLASDIKLEQKYKDHELSGNFKGCRECHIDRDWILIYEINKNILVLVLNRVGSHADLFKK